MDARAPRVVRCRTTAYTGGVNCPICQADNSLGAKTCASCGSNMKTRGGADIVVHHDGTVHHAGDSRWKTGAGMAGAGGLAGLAKLGAFGGILKFYLIFNLIRLIGFGGTGAIIGIVALTALVGTTVFRIWRRRMPV